MWLNLQFCHVLLDHNAFITSTLLLQQAVLMSPKVPIHSNSKDISEKFHVVHIHDSWKSNNVIMCNASSAFVCTGKARQTSCLFYYHSYLHVPVFQRLGGHDCHALCIFCIGMHDSQTVCLTHK